MLQITDLTFNAWGRKFLVDASVSGTVETNTVDNTSMINSGGPVAPGKEGHSERCSVTQEVREGEFRPLKRSAVDAGLI